MDTNYCNPDGSMSEKYYSYLLERARGGVGLIIAEACSVSYPEGRQMICDPYWTNKVLFGKAENWFEHEVR